MSTKNKNIEIKSVFAKRKPKTFQAILYSSFITVFILSANADAAEGYSSYSNGNNSKYYSPYKTSSNMPQRSSELNKKAASYYSQAPQSSPSSSQETLPSYLKIGGDYTYVNLKPHGHPSLTGNLGGMQVMYEYRKDNTFYEGLEFSWKQGTLNGSGATRSLLYLDAQERAGYTLAIDKVDLAMSFFTGLGYRHYGQTLTVNSAPSLRFGYNEFYVPVGIFSNYGINGYFAVGLDLTWMPQIYPAVSISPLKGASWKLDYSLSSFSVKLPIMVTPTKNKRFNILLDPFYEHWEDGKSTARIANGVPLGLPANNYNFWGVNLDFIYRF
jgi:hypothetical protein